MTDLTRECPHALASDMTIENRTFIDGDIRTPFSGYMQSGSLVPDNGVEALEQYVQAKTIWMSVRAIDGCA